ncbi:DUF2690 domain-containing protein [Streptomyces sp. NPDC054834]
MAARRRTFTTVALVFATMAFLAQAASPALAAPGCRSDACTGKNPKSQGCNADAKDVPKSVVHPDSGQHPIAWLRSSAKCHAVWAKAEKSEGWEFRIEVMNGKSYVAATQLSFEAYTAMVGADRSYRICWRDVDGAPSCGHWWH